MPEQPESPTPEPEPENTLVCGRNMTIPAENYYPAEYQGRTIYFCTQFCLETFHADPDRFYAAHSRKKDQRK
jgi:YHS domain-containing protein